MSHKRARFERIALVERDAADEDESSEEPDDEQGSEEDEPAAVTAAGASGDTRRQLSAGKPSKITVSLKTGASLVCHVCGQKGHKAGFVGAVYVDCPNKPCYLCKQPGHTTATCPHRASMSDGPAAAAASSREGAVSPAQLLLQREQTGFQRHGTLAPSNSPPWQVEAAILKLHTRRVCCLAFPDTSDSHVLSGDKKGGIAVWNFMQVHDRTAYTNIHRALVNTLRFSSWLPGGFNCASASSDGTVKVFDIETGMSSTLLQLNPLGWYQGCTWHMFYGMDTNQELGIVLAGDSDGKVHLLDPRAAAGAVVSSLQLHKPASKVNSVSVNPVGGAHVVLTGGNDHTAKLFDVRKLSSVKPPSSNPPPTPSAAATASSAGGRASRGRSRSRTSAAADACVDDDGREQIEGLANAANGAESSPDVAVAAAAGRGRGKGRGSRGGRAAGSSSSTASRTAAAAAAAAAAGSSPPPKPSSRGKAAAAAAAAAAVAPALLATIPHGRVVNHAVFSPSGRQILTTCQDNRLRVWSNLLACDGPPTREIVHSHDFNRYLTPFKAEWFPTDPSETKIICGRYISEDFGGVALHPVDIIDAASGRLVQQLTDLNLNTITPVNLPHPRLSDVIISGSSRSLYKWVPQTDSDDDDSIQQRTSASSSAAAAAAAADLVRRAAASSSSFVCVDADPGSGGKGSKGAGGAKTKGKQAGGLGSGTKTSAAAAAGTKRKGRAAAGTKIQARRRRKNDDDSGDDVQDGEQDGFENDSD